MRLLVFTIVGLAAMVFCYSILGFGGPICAIVFLFIVFNGVLDRVMQPLVQKLKA
jgi:hypothetical protein